MFNKKNRLAKARQVKRVFAQGRNFFSPLLSLKFLSGQGTRMTVVVSTKVSKKAVVRNRLKRIARDKLRLSIHKLSPGDYVFTVKPKAAAASEREFLKELETVLSRLYVKDA